MIIAVSEISQIVGNDQHRMDNQVPEGMRKATEIVIHQIEGAGKKGASIICFPQWFVGFGNVNSVPNEITDKIAQSAKDVKVDVVTGTFRIPGIGMKSRPVSLMIDREGNLLGNQGKKNLYSLEEQWQLSSDDIEVFRTECGKIVISHGDDAVDPVVYDQVKAKKPDIWVIQTNDAINVEKYMSEDKSLLDVVRARAKELSCTICAPMLKGEFMHVNYSGGSFIVTSDGKTHLIEPDMDGLLIKEI